MFVTVIELFINRIWYRTLAIIWRIYSWGLSTKTSTTHSSPVTRLPLEIVQMIIACLIYDMPSLCACNLTCYSWRIVAAPHLHHVYTIRPGSWGLGSWLTNHLTCLNVLGLPPLIKKLQIRGSDDWNIELSPELLGWCNIWQFFAFTSIQELEMEYLNIPSFMSGLRSHDRHFLPTLRSLALRGPIGSRQQIIYFIGLFQHLQDLKLIYDGGKFWGKLVGDPTLVPPFAPPLRGSLTVAHLTSVDLLKGMIELFGGIRFRSMNLLDVDGMELLLDACAETLETVVLHPTDPRGKQPFLEVVEAIANSFAARHTLQDYDLSRNRSLRTLEVPVSSFGHTTQDDTFLKHVLSTITSPAFSQITVLYGDRDFCGVQSRWLDQPFFRELSRTEREADASLHHKRFEVLCKAREVRDFQLVLHARVWGYVGERLVRMLEEAVAEEGAKKGFRGFSSGPLVTYNPQRTRDDH